MQTAFWRRPRRSTPPAPPAGSVPRPQRAAAARRSGSQRGGARRRALWLVLDRRLRMGEDSASGVPWGDGLGTGDVGRLEGGIATGIRHSERAIWGSRSRRTKNNASLMNGQAVEENEGLRPRIVWKKTSCIFYG